MNRSDFVEAYLFKYSIENKLEGVAEALRKSSPAVETNAEKFFAKKTQPAKKDQEKPAAEKVQEKPTAKKVPAKSQESDSLIYNESDAKIAKPVLKKTVEEVAKFVPNDSTESSSSSSDEKPTAKGVVAKDKQTKAASESDISDTDDDAIQANKVAPFAAAKLVEAPISSCSESSDIETSVSKPPLKIIAKKDDSSDSDSDGPVPNASYKSLKDEQTEYIRKRSQEAFPFSNDSETTSKKPRKAEGKDDDEEEFKVHNNNNGHRGNHGSGFRGRGDGGFRGRGDGGFRGRGDGGFRGRGDGGFRGRGDGGFRGRGDGGFRGRGDGGFRGGRDGFQMNSPMGAKQSTKFGSDSE